MVTLEQLVTYAAPWNNKLGEDQLKDKDSDAGADITLGPNTIGWIPEGGQSEANNEPLANTD